MKRTKTMFISWVFVTILLMNVSPVLSQPDDLPDDPNAVSVEVQEELEQLRQRVDSLEVQRDRAREKVDIINNVMFKGVLPGFFHIPGTKSHMKFGGYVRMDAVHDFDKLTEEILGFYTSYIIPEGSPGHGLDGNTFYRMSATRLNIDIRTPCPDRKTFDELRIFFETDFWPNGSFRIRHAYGEWGPLLVGQTWETWYDVMAAPIGFDYAGPPGGVPLRVPMVRWTQSLSRGFSVTGAIEDPNPEITIPTDMNAETQTRWPDFVLAFEKKQNEGRAWHLRLSGLLRDLKTQGESPDANESALGWGLYLTGRVPTFGKDTIGFGINGGEGIGHYLNALTGGGNDAFLTPQGLEPVPAFGAFGTYERFWTGKLRSNFTYGYLQEDNLGAQPGDAMKETNYAVANLLWNVTPLVEFGIEYLYGDWRNKDGAFGVGNRLDLVFIYSFTPDHPYKRHLFN